LIQQGLLSDEEEVDQYNNDEMDYQPKEKAIK
jgi:hypothetical protein